MEQREDAIDEEVSQKKLSETQMANLKDLIDKIEKVLLDKYSLSLIVELIVNFNKKLTAKELENLKTIDMKKSLLYNKLKLLEEYNLVTSEYQIKESEAKGRGYAQKVYSFSVDNYEKLMKTMASYQERPELIRDSKIVYLSLLQAFLEREKKMILNISTEDFVKVLNSKFKDKSQYFGGISFLHKKEFDFYQKKQNQAMKETMEFIKVNRKTSKNEKSGSFVIEPYFIYYGFLYFPELDNEF
ncbi:MAG: hypothetical protein HeimC3_49970 [Candidatus Heimdallarchaeota archaeon LC_3]|nr:MAG: hypothetical protein HeimC3_49970 [Candidatus Heimdallarchaeota archaeon LC_3]